jgi:hypothetical protein
VVEDVECLKAEHHIDPFRNREGLSDSSVSAVDGTDIESRERLEWNPAATTQSVDAEPTDDAVEAEQCARGALAAPDGTLKVPLTVGAIGWDDANVLTPESCQPLTTYFAMTLSPLINLGEKM